VVVVIGVGVVGGWLVGRRLRGRKREGMRNTVNFVEHGAIW